MHKNDPNLQKKSDFWLVGKENMKLGVKGLKETFGVPMGSGEGQK